MQEFFEEVGVADRGPSVLCRSEADIVSQPITGTSHVMRRAWEAFDLDGILCVETRPAIYFKRLKTLDNHIIREQHRRFWSHGVAPMMMFVGDKEVRVYSGLRPPTREPDRVNEDGRLIASFDRVNELLELRQFMHAVETEQVYGQEAYRRSFTPQDAVDRRLLRNLHAAREQLVSIPGTRKLPLKIIHRLLARMIFICYLEAREVLNGDYFGWLGAGSKASFAKILRLHEPTEKLFKLFRKLQRDFRGSMFDDEELREEEEYLRDSHVAILRRLFFDQADLADDQLTLNFDLYDFSVIPVGTISAIYEDFIRAEDSTVQRATGTYYTPPRLVDFTLDLALESDFDLSDKRVLDPACGSGAFLVAAFNRMAESWVRRHPRSRNGTRARELSRVLRNQITGVDINSTACRITCFSLYLALLDFLNPRDIRELPLKGGLPKLLLSHGKLPRANSPQTVVEGDFLSSNLPVNRQSFDLVVGNPPWSSRRVGSHVHKAFKGWKARNSSSETPADQIAYAFMWQVPKYLKKHGRACLLLPWGVLSNAKTSAFQAHWFSWYSVEKIAQLADLRFFLFDGADHPAIAIRFLDKRPMIDAHTIAFVAPKAGAAELNGDRISILPDDSSTIDLSVVLDRAKTGDAPVTWFMETWSTPRDRRFLNRLLMLPRLHEVAGAESERKQWLKGQGFQPHREGGATRPNYNPFWKKMDRYLDAKEDFNFVLVPGNCEPIGNRYKKLHTRRPATLFKGPLVLVNQGFSRVAFSPFDVLFQDSLQAIAGPPSDRKLLMFLTAVLASPLARYFVFHCSKMSTYRYPQFAELMRLPFPLPEMAPGKGAKDIVDTVARVMSGLAKRLARGGLRDEAAIEEARDETVEPVYEYYDVAASERILIEDTLTVLNQSKMPNRGSEVLTIEPPRWEHRQQYSILLRNTLEQWGKRSGTRLSVRSVVSPGAGLAVLTLSNKEAVDRRYTEKDSSHALDETLARLSKLLPKYHGSLAYLRNLKVFDGDDLHIVKPLTRRHWLRTAALNDADEIASEILMSSRRAAV